MKKIFLTGLLIMGLCSPVFATQWRNSTGENTLLGSEAGADIDTAIYQNIVSPAERLLSNYKRGCQIEYLSAATLTVTAGEVMISNSGKTVRLMQQNAAATTVAWANIDTGSEAISTTYYVYAYQATASDTDFDIVISTSATAPTGITYFRRLGSFYNNADGDIEKIINDDAEMVEDLKVKAWVNCDEDGTINDSYNVTSVTDGGTGLLTVTWDTNFATSNYVVVSNCYKATTADHNVSFYAKTAGACSLSARNGANQAFVDPDEWMVMAIGDQ